ncbi:hypothetical protein [Candidatus Enterococcus clewellii]|nr:hypothetical protein [Enterococcus sp. 9E7_DIV0242]
MLLEVGNSDYAQATDWTNDGEINSINPRDSLGIRTIIQANM